MSEFITKQSDEQMKFSTGMERDVSKDKPRFDLIIPIQIPYKDQLLTRWAELMTRGAKHYSARNWEKAETIEEFERFKESALRHLMQWICGETDEDHAAAVLFNIQGAECVKWKIREKLRLTVHTTEEAISDIEKIKEQLNIR